MFAVDIDRLPNTNSLYFIGCTLVVMDTVDSMLVTWCTTSPTSTLAHSTVTRSIDQRSHLTTQQVILVAIFIRGPATFFICHLFTIIKVHRK